MREKPLIHVKIHELCVYGFHGVLEEERRLGQRFYISVKASIRLNEGIIQDHYEDAACYGRLCRLIEARVAGEPCALIENLAYILAKEILQNEPLIEEVTILVKKPSAPMNFAIDTVSAELSLKRTYPFALSFGANMGDRQASIEAALQRLMRYEGLEIEKISSFYETKAWGVQEQENFLNLCAIGQTSLTPHQLLAVCKESEEILGRVAGARWGARSIDIDILYYGENGCILCDDFALCLPHRHVLERIFVIVPLLEIAPSVEIAGNSLQKVLETLPRSEGDVLFYKPYKM